MVTMVNFMLYELNHHTKIKKKSWACPWHYPPRAQAGLDSTTSGIFLLAPQPLLSSEDIKSIRKRGEELLLAGTKILLRTTWKTIYSIYVLVTKGPWEKCLLLRLLTEGAATCWVPCPSQWPHWSPIQRRGLQETVTYGLRQGMFQSRRLTSEDLPYI